MDSLILIISSFGVGYLIGNNNKIHKQFKKYKNIKENKQTTFVYCPKCNNELIKNGNLIEDTDFVYFKCSNCGKESKWDFDAPCPILIKGGLDE